MIYWTLFVVLFGFNHPEMAHIEIYPTQFVSPAACEADGKGRVDVLNADRNQRAGFVCIASQ